MPSKVCTGQGIFSTIGAFKKNSAHAPRTEERNHCCAVLLKNHNFTAALLIPFYPPEYIWKIIKWAPTRDGQSTSLPRSASILRHTKASKQPCNVNFFFALWATCEPKRVSEQKCKPEKRLPWQSTSYHRWLKSPIGQILLWPGAELDPLPTPNESQGTSKIFSKIFSYDPGLNLFYVIFWFIR